MNAESGHATRRVVPDKTHARVTRRLRWGFAAIAAALLCVLSVSFTNATRLTNAQRWYAHTYQVLAELNQLQADISTMDGAARGWVMLGEVADRRRFNESLSDYETRLGNMQRLTADNPLQQSRLQQLKKVCSAWQQDDIVPLIEKRTRPGTLSSREMEHVSVVLSRAQSKLNAIASLTSALEAEEDTRLRERTLVQNQSQRATTWSLILSALYTVLMLGLLLTMLDRSNEGMFLSNARLEEEIAEHAVADKDLRESQARLTALIENTSDSIWSLDLDYRLTNFNRAFYEAMIHRFGQPPVIGQEMAPFFVAEAAHWKDWYDRAFAGEHLRVEEMYQWAGSAIEQALSFSPIETEGRSGVTITGATVFSRDITERKKIDRLKNEFIATVSHELRTPLTSIRGSLGLLRGGVAGEMPAAARPLIDIAVNNADRLVRLINDILDVEKIESGKMDFQRRPLELLPLVRAAIDGAHGYGSEMNVRFELRDELPKGARIYADADRFIQVMDNLLSNAAKFSPPGDAVLISLTRHGDVLRVSVHDKGKGVPPEFHSRIFSRFAQADASDTKLKGGTGLGLSIVRAIVEKFGGSVDFDRSLESGSTFFFELPECHSDETTGIEPINVEITDTASTKPKEADDARVLICEDDPDIAELLRLMLSEIGFDADIAHDLKGARNHLATRAGLTAKTPEATPGYRAMTLDLKLPDGDGISFIRALKEDPATRDMPVIVVSATATGGRGMLQGDAVGVADWLEKPIDTARLQNAVRTAAVRDAAARKQRAVGERPRVLHIEDDPDIVRVAREILKGDADLDTAAGFIAARAKLAQNVYDLVILDITLPDGDGLELLTQLKNEAHHTPVVVFSASELSSKDAHRAEAALVKSRTSNETLLQTIQSLIPEK